MSFYFFFISYGPPAFVSSRCPVCNEPFQALAEALPNAQRSQSSLVCRLIVSENADAEKMGGGSAVGW